MNLFIYNKQEINNLTFNLFLKFLLFIVKKQKMNLNSSLLIKNNATTRFVKKIFTNLKSTQSAERTNSILNGFKNTVGNTPLIKLEKLSKESGCNILVKCEYMNPGGYLFFSFNSIIFFHKLKLLKLFKAPLRTEPLYF